MLNKRTSALFTIVNGLYVIYFIIIMIWLKEPIISSVNRQPVMLPNQVLAVIQIVMSTLSLIIFIGLARVLHVFKESLWIVLSVCLYLILQLYFNALSVMSIYRVPLPYLFSNYMFYVNYAILLYMVVAMQFVTNYRIKTYYRWIGITIAVSLILVRVTPALYESYGLRWVLINPGLLKIIPFVVSFFLFMKLAKKQVK
jgi:hypothetical protein